jgi:lycopene cyclase domain-containing protein
MFLYLIIMVLVIAVPMAFSFEKNLMLYKRWKFLLPAILITMTLFITWDIIFTRIGCWAFNPKYLSGIYLLKLPIEEYLFFISVPYACAFSFYAIKFHFPQFKLGKKETLVLTVIIIALSLVAALIFRHHLYTLVISGIVSFILIISYFFAREVLQYYYAIFLVLLIPFFVVNGILTGTGIDQEVFRYDPLAITGFRILSVPIEDLFFAFSLLLTVLTLTALLEPKFMKDQLT